MRLMTIVAAVLVLAMNGVSSAQSVTLPPNGDNQRATITQQIGLVQVSIEYSSPDVHGPTLDKLSRTAEAAAVMTKAIDLPGALPVEIHQYGRRLMVQARPKRHWPFFRRTRAGLATRGRFTSAWHADTPRSATTRRRSNTRRSRSARPPIR